MKLSHYRDTLGFDLSHAINRGTFAARQFKIACSQCEALVINGTATHERGCPHAKHECNGCNAIIPAKQRYCEDCA